MDEHRLEPADDEGSRIVSNGRPYTEYMDYWSIMGKGLDYPEMDKVKLGWIADYEQYQYLKKDREAVSSKVFSLYPADRAESKGNLIMLKFEMNGANEAYACDFRAFSGQPTSGTSLNAGGGFSRDRGFTTDDVRGWKAGLTCNFINGESRGLDRNDYRIDFNVLDGDNPTCLPTSAGGDLVQHRPRPRCRQDLAPSRGHLLDLCAEQGRSGVLGRAATRSTTCGARGPSSA